MDLMALKKPIIDACIKSAREKGWSDAMGVLRGTLFLEHKSLSLDELSKKTGYSKTTVRSNMNFLENIGLAVRVVGPGKDRYKQHCYALETDAEAMKLVLFSAAKEEIHSIVQALNQIETKIENNSAEAEEIKPTVIKTRNFYEEIERFFELMDLYSLKDVIETLEINKNKK